MAWADLSPEVQEGLNWAANKVAEYQNPDGTPIYANGRALLDAIATLHGMRFYAAKEATMVALDLIRAKKLRQAANATLAAQVDALPET